MPSPTPGALADAVRRSPSALPRPAVPDAEPGARRPLGRVATTAMVVLVAAVAVALLHPSEARTTDAVVRSASPSAVCLDAAQGALCLDPEHIEHLRLDGVERGDCLRVEYVAGWSPRSLVAVSYAPCRI